MTKKQTAPENPIPEVEDIKAMKVSLEQPSPAIDQFDVPEEHWADILNSLKPPTVDKDPKKWEGMGRITITASKEIDIDLYYPSSGPGAYAIKIDGNRTYYRGGSTKRTIEFIRESKESAAKK